jgi:hypothetical protein
LGNGANLSGGEIMKRKTLLGVLIGLGFCFAATFSTYGNPNEMRAKARQAMQRGNWKDAFELFQKLAHDPASDPKEVCTDLTNGIQCLRNLGNDNDCDDFLEKTIAAHSGNWRLLRTAAQSYMALNHQGFIVAGKFERGPHRGGGEYAGSFARDRVRALQLFQDAMRKSKENAHEADKQEFFQMYVEFARALNHSAYGRQDAWLLQSLTDLSELPDYEKGYYGWRGGQSSGAPVDADGNPVFHKLPESWEKAASDGERWRRLLQDAEEIFPARASEPRMIFAQFLEGQFEVRTLAGYGFFGRGGEEDVAEDGKISKENAPYAVHTLSDDETIAKLATGIKRFNLPKEFNYIRIYRELKAFVQLGQIFEDRRQYDKAAECWKLAGPAPHLKARVDQILNNWGQFEQTSTQPAGRGATAEFRFRNGKQVAFTACEVNVNKLLEDVKTYLKLNPNRRELDWQRLNIQNVGQMLMQKNTGMYVGAQVAAWDMDLKPDSRHFDRRVTVTTPLVKAGAYLVEGRMAGGNVSRILLWVADTVIVRKPLNDGNLVFIADAVTGKPIPNATVDFFGYRWVYENNGSHRLEFSEASGTTDKDGLVPNLVKPNDNQQYQWLIRANTPDGRSAFHGFTGMYWGRWYDHEYNQTKVFCITDRPVYRPKQTMKFKFWLNQAQYDREGQSPYAHQNFTVRINNPKGEKVLEKQYKADEFGGLDGEWALPADATLGVYQLAVGTGFDPNYRWLGSGTFRLEEYKKPEFEVKVEAPKEPVMLGDKITATIEAKYYFGAPVAEGKVKYKVLRHAHSTDWYPVMPWDWFYQPGYWWFAYDYHWWPGWREWGCKRPSPWWWWGGRSTPPEIVAENEVAVGADGVVKIEIDTAPIKAIHGDMDHRFEITAEVTDQSRRTIVGSGSVLATRSPFRVYAWVNGGHYRVGDTVQANFSARTADGKPVKGKGRLSLLSVTYDKDGKPTEREAQGWDLDTNDEGLANLQIKASRAGQYRLSYKVTDVKDRTREGGYVFCVVGAGFDGAAFRFNEIELIPDKREYKPGDDVKLMINTNRTDSTVVLFLRPANGIYLPPKLIRLTGKSTVENVAVIKKDMPNFFIEAFTIADGKLHVETKEIVVPPENRVLNVEAVASAKEYKPGQNAKVTLKVTDGDGKPYRGSLVLSVYDKAVEYISGGSNVPEIKAFFWKWRRTHNANTESSLYRWCYNLLKEKEIGMQNLGVFGHLAQGVDGYKDDISDVSLRGNGNVENRRHGLRLSEPARAPMSMAKQIDAASPMGSAREIKSEAGFAGEEKVGGPPAPPVPSDSAAPTVRSNFADTAYWAAALFTDAEGQVSVDFNMPENLSSWKIKTWAMGSGARVGQAETEVVTTKNLIIRLQAPRFFTQKDEVVLSANVHNYLKTKKSVKVSLELDGGCLAPMDTAALLQTVEIDPKGEKRVDWRVKVTNEGEAVVRMKALTDEESDAMEMRFPAYVHGMMKMDSFSGVIRPEKESASVEFKVPAERRPEAARVEVRWSPTLAGAMVDALPYLVGYPYGCTEQTLNRFLPTVITQKSLLRMDLKLADIRDKLTNLNAQEIGDDKKRAEDWQRVKKARRLPGEEINPVFDEAEVQKMVKTGVDRLAAMQCSDGGWGWFSGWGEYSTPHTTAYVVHGLQIAVECGATMDKNMIKRGEDWLKNYQKEQIRLLKRGEEKKPQHPYKLKADNLDAFTYMVITDSGDENGTMREYLYRDRTELAVYAKAMFGLALHKKNRTEQRDMIIQNIEQYLVQDDENQTAYLKLPENNWWWYWYGSEYEAQAYYLKLLSATAPKAEKTSRLVKYLINNRRHSTYWNSTRDTAVCIEALAEYLTASGEDAPDLTLEVRLDGKKVKEVKIDGTNLFTFDNSFVLAGADVAAGTHKLELLKKGRGPIYFNAYVSNFTLEDHITKAGLEIKVERKYYKLVREDASAKTAGSRGQVVNQKIEKYRREKLEEGAVLTSGELVEVELEIESKNDYEYIIFEDMKPAGFEPVEVRSGYTDNAMRAYVEFRDERVCFFVGQLARGKHSVAYRMRAEIPGRFSALPTRASAMYAPELKANSDEIKLGVKDGVR